MSAISSENIRTAVDLVTHADPRVTAHEIAERAWGQRCYLGLTADLTRLPDRKPARLKLEMRPVDLLSFHGFESERAHASSADLKQLLLRERFRLHGVSTLYLAETSRARPIYCQWLVRPSEQLPRLYLSIAPPPGHYFQRRVGEEGGTAISPDGSMLAFKFPLCQIQFKQSFR